jgi:hypothetical protein
VGARAKFLLKAFGLGAGGLNNVLGWVGAAILILGIAGIAVSPVLHLPALVVAVVLVSLLLVVVTEGGYRMWYDSDQKRRTAVSRLSAAGGAAQAKLVGVWKDLGLASGWFTKQVVYIYIQNGSGQRISNLVVCWRLENAQWGDRDEISYVMPGNKTSVHRRLPKDLPASAAKNAYSADIYFQDDNEVYWCATPREDGGGYRRGSPPAVPELEVPV